MAKFIIKIFVYALNQMSMVVLCWSILSKSFTLFDVVSIVFIWLVTAIAILTMFNTRVIVNNSVPTNSNVIESKGSNIENFLQEMGIMGNEQDKADAEALRENVKHKILCGEDIPEDEIQKLIMYKALGV